MEFRRWI